MTKANAKDDAPQTTAQQEATAPAADAPAAVVPAPAPAAPAVDEHTGIGGLYAVIEGQRVLADRTRNAT